MIKLSKLRWTAALKSGNARRRLAQLSILPLIVGAFGITTASPAAAVAPCAAARDNWFCAYSANNYAGKVLETQATPADGDIQVTRDVVNSVKNGTVYWWCGVEDRWPADVTILRTPKHTNRPSIGDAYNRIDWFYARHQEVGCD